MKIVKMKKLRNGKYQLKLSNMETVTTYDDVILKYHLLFEKELDSNVLNEINKETKYYDIYHKVLKYIATRMRSTHEVKEYIKKYQVLKKEEEKLLKELTEKGMLNDRQFASSYALDKFYLGSYGPDKIRKELEEHHIKEDDIVCALEKIPDGAVEEKIKQIIEKKVRSNHKYSSFQLKEKLMMELVQKGYSRSMIRTCLDEITFDNTSVIQKEYEKCKKRLEKKYEGEKLLYQLKGKLYQKGFCMEEIDAVLSEME